MKTSAKITPFPASKKGQNSPKTPRPPAHLSAKMKIWWSSVVSDFELEDHHLLLLTKAAEAHDRADSARKVIQKKGLTFDDRFGQPCTRPEIGIERDSRLAFARLVRELNLSEENLPDNRPRPLKYGGK